MVWASTQGSGVGQLGSSVAHSAGANVANAAESGSSCNQADIVWVCGVLDNNVREVQILCENIMLGPWDI